MERREQLKAEMSKRLTDEILSKLMGEALDNLLEKVRSLW